MMKSDNFMDNSNCPVRELCPFYQKDRYNKEDVFHYVDYCLKLGFGCKIKENHNLVEKLKQTKDFPKEKRNWRSK